MTTIAQTKSPPRRRFIRHWKERFKLGMPLIFIREVRLDAERTVRAGDPVTPELRAELGEHRLKMWWQAKRVGCAQKSVVPALVPVPARKEAKPKSKN